MLESQREQREPYLFPPDEHERQLMRLREERELRRKRYFAAKRRFKEEQNGKAS